MFHRPFNSRYISRSIPLLLILSLSLSGPVFAQSPTPPPEPPIPPIVSAPEDVDADRNKIDDRLEETLAAVKSVLLKSDALEQDKKNAQKTLSEKVSIELVFDTQINQSQIDAFLAEGGEIDHIFTHVSYGWTGRIALEKIEILPAKMGISLLGIVGKRCKFRCISMKQLNKGGFVRGFGIWESMATRPERTISLWLFWTAEWMVPIPT